MRSNRLATCLLALVLASAPGLTALASADTPAAETTPAPGPRPASASELAGYADREAQAKAKHLDEFEGGRRRGGTEATTIIIVLLVVILVLLVI